MFKIRSPSTCIGSSQQDLSKRDYNGYIRFRIILSYITIRGTKFTHKGLGQLDYNKRKIIIQYSLEAILLSKWYLILLFVQKITYLDLCHTPIDKQFYTCNIAAVIRSKE
jgi:hypothetical protein